VVRVTADCPLLDPTESGRVIHAYRSLPNCSYANNVSPQSVPAGFGTEVISMAALETSWRDANDPSDREHVTRFVRRQPERFISTCVKSSVSAPRYRLSLDTLADFTFLSAVVDRLRLRGLGHSVREVLDVLAEPDLAVMRIASENSASGEPPS
jgi:spore coat polysaccharide biosynthesis protein SpsF